jgi:Glycosyltransferase
MLLAHWMGARTILQVHAPEVDRYLNNRLQKWLLTLAFRPADRVCLLTRWWREKMWDAGIRSELRVVHNPLPSVLEQTAKCDVAPKSQNASVTVLSMARLVPGKGVDVVIRAMAMLPHHVRLVVAGDGKERKALESLARELGVENRVSFVGWAEGETKTRLLQEADIFCLPSTYDAFPMSMVEAMAFGVPVVAVRWGGIPDMVADGRAGLLANRPEPDLVAAAICELSDAEVRYRMAARAKQWILEISSAGVVGDNLSQLIQEVAECK